MSVTDEIKNRLDIVEVISDYMPLRKSGSSYSGFCPFHPNTKSPAFAVFPNSQTWHCFGACAEGGDVFSFVMKKEGWDFKEALVYLAQKAGVELEQYRPRERDSSELEVRLLELLSAAADYFHKLLNHAPQAEAARSYIDDRGLSPETQALFRVGYALDSWDACKTHFNMQGYSDEDLTEAGLLTVNEEKGSRYDRFRNRIMIPIADFNGRVVGFGARTLDKDGIPKYLNSPQTSLFDKSRLLFGLDLAKRTIREARQVVIVEGYMDVMQGWQAGFQNLVAQMGTALTEQQLQLAKRYAKRFVLALDADAAGAQATLRSLEVARDTLDRVAEVRFDAHGLVRHEGRLQADIRILTMPEGNDPDKIIRRDPEQWRELVNEARPVVQYVIDTATGGLDPSDVKAKSELAKQVMPLISDVADPVERQHYVQLLARKLRVDERTLRMVPAKRVRSQQRRDSAREPIGDAGRAENVQLKGLAAVMRGAVTPTEMRRSDFLRQCLAYPQIMLRIDEVLEKNQQDAVKTHDFDRPDDRLIWQFASENKNRRPVASIDDLCDILEDDFVRARVFSLKELPVSPESELERLPDRLVLSVLDWRLESKRGLLEEVRQLRNGELENADPDTNALYDQQLRDLPLQILSINRARGAISAIGRRKS